MTAIFLIVHGTFSTMLWSLAMVLIFVGNLCIHTATISAYAKFAFFYLRKQYRKKAVVLHLCHT